MVWYLVMHRDNFTFMFCYNVQCEFNYELHYLLTTSIECNDISMLTSTLKYSVIWLDCISFSSTSIAIRGLLSTKSGSYNHIMI